MKCALEFVFSSESDSLFAFKSMPAAWKLENRLARSCARMINCRRYLRARQEGGEDSREMKGREDKAKKRAPRKNRFFHNCSNYRSSQISWGRRIFNFPSKHTIRRGGTSLILSIRPEIADKGWGSCEMIESFLRHYSQRRIPKCCRIALHLKSFEEKWCRTCWLFRARSTLSFGKEEQKIPQSFTSQGAASFKKILSSASYSKSLIFKLMMLRSFVRLCSSFLIAFEDKVYPYEGIKCLKLHKVGKSTWMSLFSNTCTWKWKMEAIFAQQSKNCPDNMSQNMFIYVLESILVFPYSNLNNNNNRLISCTPQKSFQDHRRLKKENEITFKKNRQYVSTEKKKLLLMFPFLSWQKLIDWMQLLLLQISFVSQSVKGHVEKLTVYMYTEQYTYITFQGCLNCDLFSALVRPGIGNLLRPQAQLRAGTEPVLTISKNRQPF